MDDALKALELLNKLETIKLKAIILCLLRSEKLPFTSLTSVIEAYTEGLKDDFEDQKEVSSNLSACIVKTLMHLKNKTEETNKDIQRKLELLNETRYFNVDEFNDYFKDSE